VYPLDIYNESATKQYVVKGYASGVNVVSGLACININVINVNVPNISPQKSDNIQCHSKSFNSGLPLTSTIK
jgi:hypothetical protein